MRLEAIMQVINNDIVGSLFLDVSRTDLENSSVNSGPNRTVENGLRNDTSVLIGQYLKDLLPSVSVERGLMTCDGVKLDLSSRQKMYLLVKTFTEANKINLRREELVKKIYGQSVEELSARMFLSLNHNVVKLVSRTRQEIASFYEKKIPGLNWFPYDPVNQTWRLLRAEGEYLEHKSKVIPTREKTIFEN